MALEKLAQYFSCSGVRLSSVLIRSILASLLLTICSAVSCGAPSCVSTWTGLPPFVAAAVFASTLAFLPCLSPGAALLLGGALFGPPVTAPTTPPTTPTTPPIAPPSTPPTGPAALLPSCAPCWTPFTRPCASTIRGALTRRMAATPSATHSLRRVRRRDVGLVIVRSPYRSGFQFGRIFRERAACCLDTFLPCRGQIRLPATCICRGQERLAVRSCYA